MGLLLLDRAQLEVKVDGDALALYEAGVRRGTVPIAMIDRCVIHGAQTRLDTGVLMKLAEAGVNTVIMSTRQTRRVALVLGPQHNDAAVRLAQSARVMDESFCRAWALGVVRAKLVRQTRAVRTLMGQRPDARKPLFDAIQTLDAIAQTLTAAHAGSEMAAPESPAAEALRHSTESLRGFEGAAARAYFAGLAAVMPPGLGFSGRNRRPPRDPVNVCLSLGYTLLHSQAVSACNTAGLDPLLGFYHRPAFGRESLASDLIEPLRPAVDLWVWELLRSRTLREEHFTTEPHSCMMGKAGRAVFYAGWAAQSKPLLRWLQARCRVLANDLRRAGSTWLITANDEDETC